MITADALQKTLLQMLKVTLLMPFLVVAFARAETVISDPEIKRLLAQNGIPIHILNQINTYDHLARYQHNTYISVSLDIHMRNAQAVSRSLMVFENPIVHQGLHALHLPDNYLWRHAYPVFNAAIMEYSRSLLNMVNCYAYACNRGYSPNADGRSLAMPNPGDFSGVIVDTDISGDTLLKQALADGLTLIPHPNVPSYPVYFVFHPELDTFPLSELDDELITDADYHWYRLDDSGFWSHKLGANLVSNFDAANNLIFNPLEADHYYAARESGYVNYREGGCFLWVPYETEDEISSKVVHLQSPPTCSRGGLGLLGGGLW